LTFNYYKKSYIFLSYSFINRDSKINKLKMTFLIFYNILHCFLNTQSIKKNYKIKKNKKIIFLQKKILIKYGFLKK
ncbi:hypothetical protein, partial [Candidatus Nasuia deltocephalinicola]|uniref:hypothetical protein n=1 Tax=Candidatus Nasuia deltocephalincola TaxID=1160784 RepID=UPI00216B5DA4